MNKYLFSIFLLLLAVNIFILMFNTSLDSRIQKLENQKNLIDRLLPTMDQLYDLREKDDN